MNNLADLAQYSAKQWEQVHAQTPLIQSITNTVVQNFTANVVIAIGAAPAMVDVKDEAAGFAKIASGLLVNLGTVSPHQVEAIPVACEAARQSGTPWVLDPVAVSAALPYRSQIAREALGYIPSAIRGNASEIIALAGGEGGRGVDATDSVADAASIARELAKKVNTVIAISGETDYITDSERSIECHNGSKMLTQVTGGGCALGAVIAAFIAVGSDPLLDVAAAHSCYGIAAEKAAQIAKGSGSFAVAFLDQLSTLNYQDILSHSRLKEVSHV